MNFCLILLLLCLQNSQYPFIDTASFAFGNLIDLKWV